LNDAQRAIRRQAHHTLAKVTDDIGRPPHLQYGDRVGSWSF